jgi:hypothetical protein
MGIYGVLMIMSGAGASIFASAIFSGYSIKKGKMILHCIMLLIWIAFMTVSADVTCSVGNPFYCDAIEPHTKFLDQFKTNIN